MAGHAVKALLALLLAIAVTPFAVGCAPRNRPASTSPGPAAAPMIPEAAGVEPAVAADPSFRELRGALLPDIPELPAYPGATLVGSAERNRPNERKQGHTIKWTTPDPVPKVMAWYQAELPKHGWTYSPPSDGAASEQIARIRRGSIQGTIAAEEESGHTEILVVLGPR